MLVGLWCVGKTLIVKLRISGCERCVNLFETLHQPGANLFKVSG